MLLATFPLVLLGLRASLLLPGAISIVLYVLTQWRGWALHTYPDNQAWFFNPLAWQFLFVIGATFGYGRAGGAGAQRLLPRWVTGAAAVVAGVITFISLTWLAHCIYDPLPAALPQAVVLDARQDRPSAAAALEFPRARRGDAPFRASQRAPARRRRWARPIILCGQNSLYVFCLGIVLSVLGHFVLSYINSGPGMQAAVNLVGWAAMIGTAALLQWYKLAGRRPSGSSARAAPSE